ncbi:uncharacterized protein LOC106092090 [Stomoxys calcitrans]|uniref:uncharacterized protein LOC106092090 n=1 Tax=Stomoxys calcitrans TaxID=35570 RepID=UPI0027E2D018|nr:uncharacterized protein LOC106092090 [Stomoxys calcitrans]
MIKRLFSAIILTVVIQTRLSRSAIIPNPKLNVIANNEEGFLELRPNGTLILRSTMENSPNAIQNAIQQAVLFRTILNAIRHSGNSLNDLSMKIYGEGIEHKFPPFLERVIQRIQTYFSVYKYTDSSEPLRDKNKPITPINDTLYEEIDTDLDSDNGANKNTTIKPNAEMHKTTSSVATKATVPMKSTTAKTITTTTASKVNESIATKNETATHAQPSLSPSSSPKPALVPAMPPISEENEFNEIKNHKSKGKS